MASLRTPRSGIQASLILLLIGLVLACGGGGSSAAPTSTQPPGPPAGTPSIHYLNALVRSDFGVPMQPQVPVVQALVGPISIAPDLPAGLSFDPTTGVVQGTPLAALPRTTFKASSTYTGGIAEGTFDLEIRPPTIFAQEESFYGQGGQRASVTPLPNMRYQWSIQGLDASARIDGSATETVVHYTTGDLRGAFQLSVRVEAPSGHACESTRTLKVVGGKFLKDVFTSEQRAGHTATALKDGRVLVVGGEGALGPAVATAELFDPYTRTWAPVGSLSHARFYHAAVLLNDGRVLVAGGKDENRNLLSSAEIFDPATHAWAMAPDLPFTAHSPAATLLLDGDALFVGGADAQNYPVAHAARFNPASGEWTPVGDLVRGRMYHTATTMKDGSVMVIGGTTGYFAEILNSVEQFSPAKNTWANGRPLLAARSHHTATRLRDGRLLVVGSGNSDLEAEIFDPGTRQWTRTGDMTEGRDYHAATLLEDGRVLAAGGGSAWACSAEIYDPTSNTWIPSAPMDTTTRANVTLTVLPGGDVLFVGGSSIYGYSFADPEIFNAVTQTWSHGGPPHLDRFLHTSTLLESGSVLIAGGFESFGHGGALNTVLRFDPLAETPWSAGPSMVSRRYGHSAAVLPNGALLTVGGKDQDFELRTIELYEDATPGWTLAPDFPGVGRQEQALSSFSNGDLLVSGGLSAWDTPLGDAFRFDATTMTWADVAPMAIARRAHTSIRLPNGSLLVTGGATDTEYLFSTEVFTPGSGTWGAGPSLLRARMYHCATSLDDGRVLVSGGQDSTGPLAVSEIYDPASNAWQPIQGMLAARLWHTSTLAGDGSILVVGGLGADGSTLHGGEVYNPLVDSWTSTGRMASPRSSHSAVKLLDGRILITGGDLGYIPEYWKP